MPTRRHLILEVQKCAVISPNAAIVYNLTKMFREQIRLHKKVRRQINSNNSLTLFLLGLEYTTIKTFNLVLRLAVGEGVIA